jgi:T1SS-143 domain-containing protein
MITTKKTASPTNDLTADSTTDLYPVFPTDDTLSLSSAPTQTPPPVVTTGASVTLDETAGLQNATATPSPAGDADDNDILLSALPETFATRLTALGAGTATNAALSGYTGAEGDTGSNAFTLAPGTIAGDIKFTDSLGAPLDGLDSGLDTLDGTAILLYTDTDNNILLGRAGGPDGAIVFAAYIEETGDPVSGGKLWTVEYQPLMHPDASNPDDALNLLDKVFIGTVHDAGFSLANAPSGQNLFLMFTAVNPTVVNEDGVLRISSPTLVATGKDPADQSSGAKINTGDTVNTSQGGGPTTLGTNNQMIVEQEGIRITFVTGARQSVTVPNLDQNEADVEANIDFTAVFNTRSASFDVVQLQGGKTAVVEISAYNTAAEPGVNFINGYANDTLVAITQVRVIDTSTGLVIENSDGSVNDPGLVISFADGVATVTGVKAGYQIEYTTATDHNRVLVENGAAVDARGDDHADFDIGGFTLRHASTSITEIGSKMIFEDDGPSATGTAALGTVDEDGLANGIPGGVGDVAGEATTVSGDITGIFLSGADVPLSYALSTDTSGLPALTSGGVALVYSVSGDTLTAKAGAGGADVFTFSLSAAGAYTFTLLQPLDHPAGDDENDLVINLGTLLKVTDKDGDSVTAPAESLVITVDDDTPTASGTAVAGTVDEDGLANGIPGGVGDVEGEATSASGDVTGIFQSGADVPLSYSLATDTSGLPALTSGGVALVYSVSGDTLTAKAGAGGADVFTFSLSAAGAYTFTLLQPLDHPAGDDENDLAINLGTLLQATDKDGDTVTAAAESLVITVDDDTPTASGTAVTGTVDEDGLPNGIAGGVGDVEGEATTVNGNVSAVFQSGADVPLSYALATDTSGLPALSSGGVALVYSVSGDTLTAKAGAGGADVFTFTLSAAGAYSFTLMQPLDHPAGDDENDLAINLGSLLQATDKDGDTVTAAAESLVITVDDDTPTATGTAVTGTVDEDGLENGIAGGVGDVEGEATTVSGEVSGIFQSGADVPLSYALSSDTSNLPALTSGGVALVYSVAGDTLTAKAGAGGADVFTFTLSAAGAYSFTLMQPLDHPAGDDENDLAINLGTLLQATDKDGDTVTAAAESLVITVDDDTPTASGTAVTGTVDEDGLENGIPGGVGDVEGEATTVSGDVTGIFQSGADVPLSYALATDTSGLPALNSAGVAVVYSVSGDTLTAKAGTTDVFTFTLSAAGAYSFTLLQPLDHPVGDDENDLAINLGSLLQATDKDGDTVTAAAESLVITVDDDTPTATGTPVTGTVDEDGLANGIPGGVGDVEGEATTVSGDVTGIFQSGADVPLTYSLSSDTSGLPALASGGVALVYSVSGDTLTAKAGTTDVFTFSLSAAGAYSFTLMQPLDHPAGDDENDITLNLGALLEATDKDGDTVTAAAESLVITVDDDTPTATGTAVAGTVDEDGLENGIAGGVGDVEGEATTVSGDVSGIFQSGADVPLSYSLSSDTSGLPALSSGGVALVYSVSGETLTAKAGAGGADVFTFSLSAAGAYSFTLLQPLDHPEGDDENDIAINLGTLLQATDKDGDTVTAAANKLVITVDDDTPTATGDAEAGTVDEDGLENGIAGGVGDVEGEATTASGDVSGIFQSGADVPLSYALSTDTSGLPALSSGGVALVYSVSGDTLTAKAGAGGADVFTFSLSAAGAYTFTLLQPLDHPEGDDENDLAINLGTLLQATDKDGDTVTAAAESLVITVDDDTPTATGDAEAGTVDEDGLENGIAGGIGDVDGEATTASGNVTGIFQSGADVPLSYSLSSDTSNLPALTSGGVALVYSVAGDTLTAKAGTTDVFTFSLSAAGDYSFTLLQPLDHPAGDDENDLAINLGSLLQATDKDGDTVTAAADKLVITVDDDTPTATGDAEAGTVDEDGLANGIPGGIGDVEGEATTVSGDVTGIFQSGADVPLSYALSTDTSGLPALTSGGVALVYSVAGDTLTAKAGAGGADVFTFSLSAAGAYSFTLMQPLDHPAGDDENDLAINLGSLLQATDKDGDTVTAAADKLVITVDDDTPTATGTAASGTVDEDGLANGIAGGIGDVEGEATVASGNVTGIFQSGADVPLSYSLSTDTSGLPALSSGGVALVYSVAGDTLTAKAGAGGADVFTFSLSAAGAYTFTLLQPLDHPAGNNENDITLKLGTLLQATDKDGDTVTAAAKKLVITIDDDTPTATGTAEPATVDEDGLANGIAGGVGDVEGEATTASGDVTAIFQSGADVPLSYALSTDTSGLPALTSGGVALVYSVAGDTLTAKAGAGGADVFTFSLSAAGAYSFTLLQPLDHPAGDDENDLAINLGTLLQATDKDGDTVTAAAESLVITVDDDTPTASGTAVTGTVDEDGLPNGIPGGIGDVAGEATVASGDVTGIFQSGADVPLSYSVSSDTSGLPALSSGGVALVYSVSGDTLTAKAGVGGADVFTFSLSAAGAYTFTLLQPLDHPAGEEENDLAINLGTLLQATDKDGDTVTAAAESLVITVDDDTPAVTGNVVTGTVDEDGLANGIAGGIGDVEGEATTASGDVSGIFQSGADVPLSYSVSSDTSGLPALTSGGVALVYSVAGNTLTAKAGTTDVFTFSLSAAGAYSFTLLQPLDHPAGDDENDLAINLGSLLQATDKDGDTVTAAAESLVITVDDDTPLANGTAAAGTVDEDGLANGIAGGIGDVEGEATTVSGNVTGIFQSGADVPLSYALAADTSGLPALSSGGVALVYSVSGDTLTAKAGAGGADVFTFSLNAAGDYSFTLLQPLDHPAGNDENDISLNLGTLLQATDKDGDTVTAAANKLVITIDDDTPTANGTAEIGIVDEDGLPNGIAGGVGDVPGEATVATGNVTGIFQSGADVPLSYSLSSNTSGLPALTSGGVALVYSVVGNTLTAKAGTTDVFTLSLTVAGAYTFTLLQALDHPAGNDENNLILNLGTLLQATDKDGDTVTAAADKLVIGVNDDTPVLAFGNLIGTGTELAQQGYWSAGTGADGLGAAGLDISLVNGQFTLVRPDSTTSIGTGTLVEQSPSPDGSGAYQFAGTLTADFDNNAATANTSVNYTLTAYANGTYALDLEEGFRSTIVLSSADGSLDAGGPDPVRTLTIGTEEIVFFGANPLASPSGDNSILTGIGLGATDPTEPQLETMPLPSFIGSAAMNVSTAGIGIANNLFQGDNQAAIGAGDESFVINPQSLLTSIKVYIDNSVGGYNTATEDLYYRAFYEDGTFSDLIEVNTLTPEAGGQVSFTVEQSATSLLDAVQLVMARGEIKIPTIEFAQEVESLASDVLLSFNATVTDRDGDTATSTFDANLFANDPADLFDFRLVGTAGERDAFNINLAGTDNLYQVSGFDAGAGQRDAVVLVGDAGAVVQSIDNAGADSIVTVAETGGQITTITLVGVDLLNTDIVMSSV